MKQLNHGDLIAAVNEESRNLKYKISIKVDLEDIRWGKVVHIKKAHRNVRIENDGTVTATWLGQRRRVVLESQNDWTLSDGRVVTVSHFKFA